MERGRTGKKTIKVAKIVDWVITDTCNYSCSYCRNGNRIVSEKSKDGSLDILLSKIKKNLKGSWRFNLLGGEPFIRSDFLYVTEKLVSMGHHISIYSNFSSPWEKIEKFLKITGKNLDILCASLHLEQADVDDFIEKAKKVKKMFPDIFVISIADKNQKEILSDIAKRINKHKIPYIIRRQRLKNDDILKYPKDYLDFMKKNNLQQFAFFDENKFNIIDRNLSKVLHKGDFAFKGCNCWAGSRYFILLNSGNAFKCFPAKREEKGYLGNMLDDTFSLEKNSSKCEFDLCFCNDVYFNGFIEKQL